MRPKSSGLARRARNCTTCSRSRHCSVPIGSSVFSLRSAALISSTPIFIAAICSGLMRISTSRATPPSSETRPTPEMVSKRFLMNCVARLVSVRKSSCSAPMATEMMGISEGS